MYQSDELQAILHLEKPLPAIQNPELFDPGEASSGSTEGWKPWTYSTGILLPALLFSASLVAVLGVLQWQNARHGAIFFASNDSSFSAVQTFLYRYFPTIIIVGYSMFWSWIDLDVKRLEPWFQLSKAEGESADKSLLLRYPADFLPFVPFKAAKRRQWTVLSASAVMILVTWGVTPLQNGIFNNSISTLTSEAHISKMNSFIKVESQSALFSGRILSSGYASLWLGQKLPPFTTYDYTLAPFTSKQAFANGANSTISYATTQYETRLKCWRPVQFTNEKDSTVTFDDGEGCYARSMIAYPDKTDSTSYAAYYFGYYDDPHVDMSLASGGCSQNASHKFLAIWKRASQFAPDFNDPSNATALFCTPSYFTQDVDAVVAADDNRVISVLPRAPAEYLSGQKLNITHFEYLLGNGIAPESARQDIASQIVIHQDTQLQNMSLLLPVTNMVGFAVGATHYAPEAYLDAENLAFALERAHKLLFALAAQAVLDPSNTETEPALQMTTLQTIVVVPAFAIASQVVLFFVLACTSYLFWSMSRKDSHLSRDPDSLANVMSVAQDSDFQQLFSRFDSSSDQGLSSSLGEFKFKLSTANQTDMACITIQHDCDLNSDFLDTKRITKIKSSSESIRASVRPVEYSCTIGVPICLSIAFLIALLVYLFSKSTKEDGIHVPSSNALVQQILFNYLPTSLATIMEPFWVLLSRITSLMIPLEQLRMRRSPARKSLLLHYSSVPPQLLMWRALKNGHVLLGVLSGVAVAANVLTVTLSGLFSLSDVAVTHEVDLSLSRMASFDRQDLSIDASVLGTYSQNDAFWILQSNFSSQSSLPNWVSPHWTFLPLESADKNFSKSAANTEANATGFGADLACLKLETSGSDAWYDINFSQDAMYVNFTTSHRQSDGSVITCKSFLGVNTLDDLNVFETSTFMKLAGDPTGSKALEFSSQMVPFGDNTTTTATFCNNLLVKGWFRANLTSQTRLNSGLQGSNNITNRTQVDLTTTVIACQPKMISAPFDIIVDQHGSIISATQLAQANDNQTSLSGLSQALTIATTLHGNINFITPAWHNDTFASDWSNYLIKTLTNSTSFLDVTHPVPDGPTAIALTTETYRRLFAVQLSLLFPQLTRAPFTTPSILAHQFLTERRVFMSTPLFYISISILSLNLIVAVIFYSTRPPAFLPRLPLSIASQIAYFAGSHVIDDVMGAGGDLKELDKKGYRYGYGKYIGRDGWAHVGIEREPFVTSLPREKGGLKNGRELRSRRFWDSEI